MNKSGVNNLGKLPPQATDLEEAVLGALMLEKEALTTVIEILKPESFYKDSHKEIFTAILQLFDNSEPIDILTVTNQLRKNGTLEFAGGAFYISGLTQKVNSAANVEFHARIVSEMAIKRELITIATEIEQEAYEDTTDTFNLLDKVEQKIFGVSESNIRKNYADMRSIMRDAINELESKKHKKDGLTGVPSGFTALDRVTSGWQKSDMVIIAARPGMGKCLGKGTKVLMYDGSLKKVEEVRPGDLLMGDDSTPRRVRSIARGRERMYWIRQHKGMDYRVNESHILSLKRSRNEGGHRQGDVLNISVGDYLKQSDKFKSNYKGYKVAVEFEEKPLSIAPYFLGLWLGDGDTNSARITSNDAEVIAALQRYASEINDDGNEAVLSTYDYPDRCNQYAITRGYRGGVPAFSIKQALRKEGVLGNKHIPKDYLCNSRQNRLELLAGLIDSDGHYLVQSNRYEISQKRKALAEQIKFLCDSLGFRTSIRKKKASISATGFVSESYRIRIYGDLNQVPVRVKRKQARAWKSKVDWKVTGIEVEYDQVDDYYGFEIDGNRLFLLEDMTVTHNTAFVLSAMRNAAVEFGHAVAIFSLEMSAVQLVNRLISAEAQLESEKIKKGSLQDFEWEQLYHKTADLTEAPIYIDDTPALSIRELRSKCRRLKAQHNIELIIVDYLQLMSGDSSKNNQGNREQEIASISRAMKNIAKELDVPVLALSQLSRAVETRGGDKRPQLSDLRESGCLTGDTLVLNPETGERIPIRELAERQAQTAVLGVDHTYRLAPRNATKVFYSGKKQVYELKLRSGRKIKASANHPFLKLTGWERLDQLAVGDRIAVPRKIRVNNPSNPLSRDELALLAHLIGDGCILPRQPYHYISQDPANLEMVRQTAASLFGIEARLVPQKNWHHLYLPSPYRLTHGKRHPITQWYERLGMERVRASEKRLPDAIFRCDEAHIAHFLHHLWATDGNISRKHAKGRKPSAAIYYGTTSEVLAEQVQHLLLRLGIPARISQSRKGSYRPSYNVQIQAKENQLRFLQMVGCYGKRGDIIPELLSALEDIETSLNYDVIPKEAWQTVINDARLKAGLSWRSFQAGINMKYCGSSLFKSGISRARMERIATLLAMPAIQQLAQSDVLWEEIEAITPLGVEDVYDATVSVVHNFVANDIIVHNSIEQDADMVMFLYRPEYYGITEDEDNLPVQGTGEVIIAKHRNGALDTVRLKFIGKYTKFTDLEDTSFDGSGYGNQLMSAGSSEEFDDSNIVTFASKANNRRQQDDEPDSDDDAPFSDENAPF